MHVAHNPARPKALVAALKEFFLDKKICLFFGVQEDKDHAIMIYHLASMAERMFLTQAQWKDAEDPGKMAQQSETVGVPFQIKHRVKGAVSAAQDQADPDDIICITVTHFAVDEAVELKIGGPEPDSVHITLRAPFGMNGALLHS